jgi:hypothetical protein
MRQQRTFNNKIGFAKLCTGSLMSLCMIWGLPAHAQQSAEPVHAGSEEASAAASAADAGGVNTEPERWNAKFQATYVWQRKPSFSAPYTGEKSLLPGRERSYSFTTTASLGYRPWAGGRSILIWKARRAFLCRDWQAWVALPMGNWPKLREQD